MGKYNCAKCGDEHPDQSLEVSHFFNVRKAGTRFDPDNVVPLHRNCHTGHFGWEYQKRGAYREYMVKLLGAASFAMLEARSIQHMSLEAAKAEFIERLAEGTLWSN